MELLYLVFIIHLKWLIPFAPLRLTNDLTPVIISNGSSSRSVIGPWSLRLVSKAAPLVLLPPAVLAPVPWPKVVSIERSPSNASLAVSSASDVVKSASGRAKSAAAMDYKIGASCISWQKYLEIDQRSNLPGLNALVASEAAVGST